MANAINEITAGALTQNIGTGTTVQILYRIGITPSDTIGGGVQVNPSGSSDVQRFRNSFIGNLAPFSNSTGYINQFTLGDFVLVQSRNSANQVLRTDVGRIVARSVEDTLFGNIDIDFELGGTGAYVPPLNTHRGNYSIIRGDDVVGGVTSTEDFRIEAGLILPGLPNAGSLSTDANGRVTVNPPQGISDIEVTTDVGAAVADRGFPSAPNRGDWHTTVTGTEAGLTFAPVLDSNGNSYHFGVNNAGGIFAVVANILLREVRVSNPSFFGKQSVIPSLDHSGSLPTLAWREEGSTDNNAFNAVTNPTGWRVLTAVEPIDTYNGNIRVAAPTGAGQTFDNTYGVIPRDSEVGYVTGMSPDTTESGLFIFDGSEWEPFDLPASAEPNAIAVFDDADERTQALSILRFEGTGVSAVETTASSGDVTVTIDSLGDNFSYELASNFTLDISEHTGQVSFINIPDEHDYIVGATGYAKSRDLGDEFTFEVAAVDRTANFISVEIIETLRVSGNPKGFWEINNGPPAERYAVTSTSDVGTNERAVQFARDTSGRLHGKVNVDGIGSSGTGTGTGESWVYQSLNSGGSREDELFTERNVGLGVGVGQTAQLNLHGLDNAGWRSGQIGHLIAGNANGSVQNVIVNFRVTDFDSTTDPDILEIVIVDSILFTHEASFFWAIYPGLADVPVNADAYTDLNTTVYNSGPADFNRELAADENLTGVLGRDTFIDPTVPGTEIHIGDVDTNLSWVIGQSGYAVHASGNAAFSFIVIPADVGASPTPVIGDGAFTGLFPGILGIEVVDLLYNTLGANGNNGANNRWSIFAGAPTPDVFSDETTPPPLTSGSIEIQGDIDEGAVPALETVTTAASRIIFDENDFFVRLGTTEVAGAPDYDPITQGGVQIATDLYAGSLNSDGPFFFPVNIQIGIFDAALPIGTAANIATANRSLTTPVINNTSGLVIAIQTNIPAVGVGGVGATYQEILTVRNDTDSNGNRARIRADFVGGFDLAQYQALGINVPLFFRDDSGGGGTTTTDDPNQVIITSKAAELPANLARTVHRQFVNSTTSPGTGETGLANNGGGVFALSLPSLGFTDVANPPLVQVYELPAGSSTVRTMIIPNTITVPTAGRIDITFNQDIRGTVVLTGTELI